MSLVHRLSGLLTALLATAASTFCVLAVTVCNFAEINALSGSSILSASGEELMVDTADIGIFCGGVFYDESDTMWDLSQYFFYFSISLGGAAIVLSLAVSTFLPPTDFIWALISGLAAGTAVLQVPIFIIFGSEPCAGNVENQTCSLSLGSYYLIGSTTLWVVVTLFTQFTDPPTWAEEMAFWRIPKNMESVIVVDDEELGSFPPNAPASRLEQARMNKVEKESKKSDLTLQAVRTDSMKDDEFDWSSPRLEGSPQMVDQSQDTLPTAHRKFVPLDTEVSWLHERAKSMALETEESWLHERAVKSAPLSLIVTNAQESIEVQVGKQSPPSPLSQRSLGGVPQSGSELSKVSGSRDAVATSAEILADLQAEAKEYSDKIPLTSPDKGALDSFSLGLRALTGKLTRDARRKRHRRMPRRSDYLELGDDGDFSDDEPFMSPPIEVKILPFADFETANLSDDEEDNLMNDWEALHRATSAGARLGLQEGYSDESDWIEFDSPIQGYHSDPEPAYQSSETSRSHGSSSELNASWRARGRKNEDNSTISGLTSDSKKASRRRGRRKSKSPNVSVVSGGVSLLDVTIDEETDQDVLKEITGEEDLLGAYGLQRVLSEPMPAHRSEARTAHRSGQHLETISLNPSMMYGRMGSATKKSPSTAVAASRINLVENQDHVKTNEILSLSRLDKDRPGLEVIDTLVPKNPVPSSPKATPLIPSKLPIQRTFQARSLSLSPKRHRSLKLETWKTDSRSLGGINARRATKFEDDSSTQSSEGSEHSKSSMEVREFRIRRIKRMKEAKRLRTQYDSYGFDRRQASNRTRIRNAYKDVTQRSHHSDHSDDTEVMHGSEPINSSYQDQDIRDKDTNSESPKVPLDNGRSYGYNPSNKSYLERGIPVVTSASTSAEVQDPHASAKVMDAHKNGAVQDADLPDTNLNTDASERSKIGSYGSERRGKSYRHGSIEVLSGATTSAESTMKTEASSESSGSEQRNKSYRDRPLVISKPEVTSTFHLDRRTILSDLLRDAQSNGLYLDGKAADGDSIPDDFADLDYGPTSKYLPKFSVNLGQDRALEQESPHSPAIRPRTNNKSPEVSPILQDNGKEVCDGVADVSAVRDDSYEHPTLTTENDSTMILSLNDELDEFPVDTDMASITGIEKVASRNEYDVSENLDMRYGSFDMDDLDLQLISVLRPLGKEYGDDEESL